MRDFRWLTAKTDPMIIRILPHTFQNMEYKFEKQRMHDVVSGLKSSIMRWSRTNECVICHHIQDMHDIDRWVDDGGR